MRRILTAGSVVATLLTLTNCGGGQPPTSPSPSMPAASVAVSASVSSASLVVPWSCLTQSAPRMTGIFSSIAADAACPARPPQLTRSSFAAATAPGPPGNLTSSINSTTVNLGWSENRSGDAATSYVIEAGSSSGASDILVFDTGTSGQGFTATAVPTGRYFVRVRARTGAGTSDPSNEVIVTVGGGPCAGAPGATSSLTSSVSGSSLSLSWAAPASGCGPTGYVIQAGSTPGSSNLADFNTGSTATTFSATDVPAGRYYVRVTAANGFSAGSPSNEVTVVVGGTTFTPTPTPTPTSIRWVGQAPDGMIVTQDPQDQCPAEYDLQLDLAATGTVVTGTATTRTRRVEAAGDCSSALGQIATWTLVNGTIGSGTISFDLGSAGIHRFSGTFTATRMTGTFVTTQNVPRLTTQTGSFAVTRQ